MNESDQSAESEATTTLQLQARIRHGVPEPRRIRLQIPGWAGASTAHGNGADPMPWHCQPFVEAATYGLELVYPYQNECSVYNDDGRPGYKMGSDLEAELLTFGKKIPFDTLSPGFYGMGTWLDLLPPDDFSLRLETHPRFYTSRNDDVPIAVPGHLQPFWPRQFFAIFRTPSPGHVHVFRPGEAYAQLVVMPTRMSYKLIQMDNKTAEERFRDDGRIDKYRYLMVKHLWKSSAGTYFDDLYKQLARMFRKGGRLEVANYLQTTESRVTQAKSADKGPSQAGGGDHQSS